MTNNLNDELDSKVKAAVGWANPEHRVRDVKALISEQVRLAREVISHSQYVDWETGDDDVMRVGDWVFANRQDHEGHDVQDFTAKIVRHYDNGLPMFLTDIDPKDPDNSGYYHSIEQAWLSGFEFSRIKEPSEYTLNIGTGIAQLSKKGADK